MHDGGKILIGLGVFLAVVTMPMWYHAVTGTETAPPELVLPTDSKQCVAETDYMRALHMDLLNEWRDDVVRRADRIHVGIDGKEYDKSLTNTCLGCHTNKKEFWNRCHDYAGVDPYCWECHVDPGEIQ